jgi:dTDP-glucose 4,6-dehydratase
LLEGEMTTFDPPPGRFQYVIHAATESYCEPDATRPLGTFDTEIAGTRRVLEFARTHGVRRFLLTSSGAVYGIQPPTLTHVGEDYAGAPSTTNPVSAYGHAKRVSEYMCTMYGHVHGFDALIARLFAFVGPLLPLHANFAVGNFIRDALSGGPIRIGGDGTPYRSYLYAADLAIWLWTIVFRATPGRPYNVGSPQEISIADLARLVVEATAVSASVETARQPERGALASRYVPDVDRAQAELGLAPLVSLDSAIRKTYTWHRAREAGGYQE